MQGFVFLLVVFLTIAVSASDFSLYVGNTRADNIVEFDSDGKFIGEVLGPSMGILNPDVTRIVDGYLYAAIGDTPETSAIYRLNLATGESDPSFASGGGLFRPYGFAFHKERIYVASFRSDRIIVYDMNTGDYIGVFAQGNGTEEGLCNGPNHIAIYENSLYLTTQGSVANSAGDLTYGLASQVVVYNLRNGEGKVFIPQPEPLPDGLGFISMLGIHFVCMSKDNCVIYTTDFAGGLRAYTLLGELIYAVETTYVPGASTGALAIVDGEVYIPGFVDAETPGVVQRFLATDGSPLPAMNTTGAIFIGPDENLVRPIGILAVEMKKRGTKRGRSGKRGKSMIVSFVFDIRARKRG